jgi:glycosyltransferase involved in cell wall biosynthesis
VERGLVVVTPIEPRAVGNGLAMRIGHVVEAVSAHVEVRVAVVPVAGEPPGPALSGPHWTVRVEPTAEGVDRSALVRLLSEPSWRGRFGAAGALPRAARVASPVLGEVVAAALGHPAGWPVHVARSALAPLGVAVAEQLDAPWLTLDLDDDEEPLLRALEDHAEADAHHRLLGAFGPLFSSVFLAAPAEARAVAGRHGLAASVLPNAVRVPPRPSRDPKAGRLLFVGNLTFRPNIDAAVTLVEQVLPAVRARTDLPVSVALVGPHDGHPAVLALAGHPGVVLLGYVPELALLYEEAIAVVVPLEVGGGTRIKLLEAFAHLVPVVATPAAAAGLAVESGVHLLVGDTSDELADHVLALLEDPRAGQRIALAARAYVERCHAVPIVANTVHDLLRAAARRGRPHDRHLGARAPSATRRDAPTEG